MGGISVKLARYVSIGILAGLALFTSLTGSAYAAHLNYAPNLHYRMKNSLGRHGLKRHKPKKLKNSKSRFRSPVTGNLLYGKPVKQK